jgi:DNA-binding NtrC family response regulator
MLVEHLLATAVGRPLRVSPSAMAALVDHDWPGNVRQLENELQRAALLCVNDHDRGRGQTIELSALSPALRGSLAPDRPEEVEETEMGLQESMRAYERRLIHQTLEATGYNVSQAADRLGLHRVALHRKMRKLGLSRPRS